MIQVQRFFLKMKHWQIMGFMVAVFFLQRPYFVLNYHLIQVVMGTVLFTWIYSICGFISVKYGLYTGTKHLAFGCWVAGVSYIIYSSIFGMFGPVHVVVVIGIFYNLVLAARSLSGIEYKESRKVKFWIALFSIWFFPLGIWYVQPILNRVEKNSRE